MSDQIQVRRKCTRCVRGTISRECPDGNFHYVPCNICSGTEYFYRWVTFEEAGISIQQPAKAT